MLSSTIALLAVNALLTLGREKVPSFDAHLLRREENLTAGHEERKDHELEPGKHNEKIERQAEWAERIERHHSLSIRAPGGTAGKKLELPAGASATAAAPHEFEGKSLTQVEERLQKQMLDEGLTTERMGVFRQEGDNWICIGAVEQSGSELEVKGVKALVEKAGNPCVITHNHPTGRTFSLADYQVAVKNSEVKGSGIEIRAVTTKEVYSMKFNPEEFQPKTKVCSKKWMNFAADLNTLFAGHAKKVSSAAGSAHGCAATFEGVSAGDQVEMSDADLKKNFETIGTWPGCTGNVDLLPNPVTPSAVP